MMIELRLEGLPADVDAAHEQEPMLKQWPRLQGLRQTRVEVKMTEQRESYNAGAEQRHWLKIGSSPDGDCVFICFARHIETGETLLIYERGGTIHARPWGENDLFDGAWMAVDKRFFLVALD